MTVEARGWGLPLSWRLMVGWCDSMGRESNGDSAPLGELLGEGTFCAIAEILEAEIVIELEQGLVVGQAFQEWLGRLLRSEKADAAAFEFLVHGGVALLVVVPEGEALLVEGEGDEVVCGQLEREAFPEDRDRLGAAL